jgi:proline dehydrogenase
MTTCATNVVSSAGQQGVQTCATLNVQALGDLTDLRKHVTTDDGAATLKNAEDLLRGQAEV